MRNVFDIFTFVQENKTKIHSIQNFTTIPGLDRHVHNIFTFTYVFGSVECVDRHTHLRYCIHTFYLQYVKKWQIRCVIVNFRI